MTVLALGAAAALAAAGTRAAALAFLGGALAAVIAGGDVLDVAVWTCVLGAGVASFASPVRRLALPAIAAGAALAAAAAGNSAVVLSAWTVGTAACLFAAGGTPEGRRWTLGLLASDALVAAAVVRAALGGGFVEWPSSLDQVGAGLLLVAAAVRIPLAATPGRDETGLLAARTQIAVLVLVSCAASHQVLLETAVLGAAVAFAAAARARSPELRDAAQEVALFAMAVAAARLGWETAGWGWAALAGGTLIHYLRLRVRAGEVLSAMAAAVLDGGGIGLPLLPAMAAIGAAAAASGGRAGVVVVVGLAGGLAGRARFASATDGAPPAPVKPPERLATGAAVVVALAASLWPVIVSYAGSALPDLPWPPWWAGAVVLVTAAAGSAVPALAPRSRPRRPQPPGTPALTSRVASLLGVSERRGALVAPLALLILVSAALWIVGWMRGFL